MFTLAGQQRESRYGHEALLPVARLVAVAQSLHHMQMRPKHSSSREDRLRGNVRVCSLEKAWASCQAKCRISDNGIDLPFASSCQCALISRWPRHWAL